MKQILYRVTRPLIKIFVSTIYRPHVIGRENIPKEGSVVLAGNHTNNLDCIVLISSTKRTIRFLGKHTLFKGISGIIMRGMGVIPVDRTKAKNPEAMNSAKEVLDDGGIIGIFPEGTINRTDEIIMPFKMGAVALAEKTNSSIVPFVITGEYRPFGHNLEIEFLCPLRCTGKNITEDNETLMKLISETLERKKNENN